MCGKFVGNYVKHGILITGLKWEYDGMVIDGKMMEMGIESKEMGNYSLFHLLIKRGNGKSLNYMEVVVGTSSNV